MFYVAVQVQKACLDFLLPRQDIWHGQLTLPQTITGLAEDIAIPVRCMEGIWMVGLPEKFRWQGDASLKDEREVVAGENMNMASKETVLSLFFTVSKASSMTVQKYMLNAGQQVTIGNGAHNTIHYDNKRISSTACMLSYDGYHCSFQDNGSRASYINHQQLPQTRVSLTIGDEIILFPGLKIVYLGNMIAVSAANGLKQVSLVKWQRPAMAEPRKAPEQMRTTVDYHRAPRLLQRPDVEPVDVEPPIAKSDQNAIPLILTVGPSMTMVFPMLMGTMIASMSGSNFMGAGLAMIGTSSVLAVTWGLANARYRKRNNISTERKRQRLYRDYIKQMEQKLMSLNQEEQRRLLRNYPSAAECCAFGDGRSGRLWERMPTHADFMAARFGQGSQPLPSPINISKPQLSLVDDPMRDMPRELYQNYGTVRDVPIFISLRTEPIVGVFGKNNIRDIITSMIVQLAALQSYHDVKIVIISDETKESQWMWARWLPHVYPTEDRNLRMVACCEQARREVFSYLEEVIQMRRETGNDEDEKEELADPNEAYDTLSLPLPHYVVFVLSPELIESESVMNRVLSHTPGFTLVCVADRMERLPKECRVIVSTEPSSRGVFTTTGDITQVNFDQTDIAASVAFARDLTRMRVHDTATSAAIPSIVSFLELYNTNDVQKLDVWRFWNENRAYEGLTSTIGLRAAGKPFVLDISDKKHGPHGLVAGTTGSGKSVMLQTYILSLALNYHPSQVQFILIDYKGGGMADAFLNLPHLAGTIDNLQGIRAIHRALASIKGEINRREGIFKAAGVFSIDEYMRTFHDTPDHEPLSHLIIIVDEFAELKKEQPDFMHELISASRVGRSVGIHLILATQKPSNSVDDEIWSNARFRVCLRVQSRADSMDMIKRADAAYIKGMGRCYVQIGNDEIFEEVQTSWSGAKYRPNETATLEKPRLLNKAGQPMRVVSKKSAPRKNETTQMTAVMDRILEAAKAHGVSAAQRLWLNVLPSRLHLNEISVDIKTALQGSAWEQRPYDELRAVVGLADDLSNQRHMPVELDFIMDRNHLIVGLASSGKTTLLQTLVLSLCARYTPDRLNIYILSLSSRSLTTLDPLPQIGDIVFEGELYETLRMLRFLESENERRANLFATVSTDNFVSYQRSAAANKDLESVSAIVVIVDRIVNLEETLDETQQATFHQLIREGSSRGIYFVVTALGMDEVFHKVRDCFHPVALQLNQRSDYTDILHRRVPPEMADIEQLTGRGMIEIDSVLYEWQAALFGQSDNDADRAVEIAEFTGDMKARWSGAHAPSMPRIPAEPTWDTLYNTAESLSTKDPLSFPLGYLCIEGEPATVDLYRQHCWITLSNRGGGKTTYLQGIVKMFAQRDAEIHVFGSGEMQRFAARYNAVFHAAGQKTDTPFNAEFLAVMKKRTEERSKVDANDEIKLRKFAMEQKPYVIVIDDLDLIASAFGLELMSMFASGCHKGGGMGFYLFASVSNSKVSQVKSDPLYRALCERQSGVVLSSKLADISDWDVSAVPFSTRKITPPQGEGFLLERSSARRIRTMKA